MTREYFNGLLWWSPSVCVEYKGHLCRVRAIDGDEGLLQIEINPWLSNWVRCESVKLIEVNENG